MDSLREIYQDYKRIRAYCLNLTKPKTKEIRETYKELHKIVSSIICPNCLKTLVIDKIEFTCPHCDEIYPVIAASNLKTDRGNIEFLGSAFLGLLKSEDRYNALFEECRNGCEIKYMLCPHCEKEINLFAPYDYAGLKKRRLLE